MAAADAGLSVGVLICYESAFSDAARRLRSAGADLLVNLTNDSWFGGPSPGSRTHALWQHPAHLVMRAIETRTSIARAADTGFSLFVDPTGRVVASTALFEERVLVRPVMATEGLSLFVRFGDIIGLASLVAALLMIPVGLRSRHRHRYFG